MNELIFLPLSCNLVLWYEPNKKLWDILVCFSLPGHVKGNQHGSCEYDDLQNWLDVTLHETLYCFLNDRWYDNGLTQFSIILYTYVDKKKVKWSKVNMYFQNCSKELINCSLDSAKWSSSFTCNTSNIQKSVFFVFWSRTWRPFRPEI